MKAGVFTFSVVVLLIALPDLMHVQSCFSGQTLLTNFVNVSTGSGFVLTGYPILCVDGTFLPLCNSSSLTYLEAESLCIIEGQYGGYFEDLIPPSLPSFNGNTSSVVTNYTCSALANCNNAVSMGSCPNGFAILSCPSSVCDDDAYPRQLFNNYTTTVNGTTLVTGIYQSCNSGRYFRYCNRPGINYEGFAYSFCSSMGYTFGRSLPVNSSLQLGSPKGIGYFECSGPNCNTIVASTNNQCYRGTYDLVIQCTQARMCEGSGLSYYRNVTTYANGMEIVAGIVTNCLFGVTAVLCNNNPISPSTIQAACSFLGFQGGSVIPPNPSLYGSAPLGSIYYTNYACPLNATSSDNCTAVPVSNIDCYNGQNDVILRCYRLAPTTLVPSMTSTSVTSAISMTASVSVSSTTTMTTISSTATPTSSSNSDNVRLIAGVAVGAMVFVLVIIIIVVVVLLFVYIVKTGSRGPFKKKEPVELYKFSDVNQTS